MPAKGLNGIRWPMASFWALGILCITVVVAAACAPPGQHPTDLETVRVQTMWVPNGQFAGYYAATELGYYAEEGIDVRFNEYDPAIAVRDMVASGEAQFGIDGAEQVLIGRGHGQRLTAIAVLYRLNPTGYASLASSEVTRPCDLEGSRVGVLPDSTGSNLSMLLRSRGIDESKIRFVEYTGDLSMLYEGEVDAIPVYVFDEPYLMERDGYDVSVLILDDWGVHTYGDTLFTSEDLIADRPELVQGMVRATLRGWQFVVQNPERAADIVLQYDSPDYHDRDYELYIILGQIPLIHTGQNEIGWMEDCVWTDMHDALEDLNLLDCPVPPGSAHTMQFVEATYKQ